MDRFSQLLADSQFSMLILGNEAKADFLLTEDRPWSDEQQSDIERRELCFAGVLGIVEGRPRSALAVPMSPATINSLSQDFVRRAMTDPNTAELLVTHFVSIAGCDPSKAN